MSYLLVKGADMNERLQTYLRDRQLLKKSLYEIIRELDKHITELEKLDGEREHLAIQIHDIRTRRRDKIREIEFLDKSHEEAA